MKFMLMMQGTRSGWESMGRWQPNEIEAHIHFMMGLVEELQATGELLLAEGLDMPANAKLVRAVDPAERAFLQERAARLRS